MMPGYIYIVGFFNGTIKVGQTKSLIARMRQYEDQAKCYDRPIEGVWHQYVDDPGAGEERLIEIVKEWGGAKVAGREWFKGVAFGAMQQWADFEFDMDCHPHHETFANPGEPFIVANRNRADIDDEDQAA